MGRTYSDGFVHKNNGTWRAVVDWRGDDGKKHRLTKSTGIRCYSREGDNRNKAHAEAFLREWRDGLVASEAAGEGDMPRDASPTLECCESFLALHQVKATTRTGYSAAITKMRGTPLGAKPLCDLTADDVRAWERGLREGDGLSETTIAHYHAFLAQVLKAAVAEGKLARNPVAALKAPRRRPKPVNSLTSEQRADILERLDAMGTTPFTIGVRIALLTGMRRGEICALRWQDVDLEGRVVHVVHGLTKDRGFVLDTPKDPVGGDATRDIPIGWVLTGHLRAQREAQLLETAACGGSWDPSLYVIGDPLTGAFKNPEAFGREWRMFAEMGGWKGTQGERPRLHDLRHTFATLAIKDRVMDIMALARILGHRDATVTLNLYADALEESKRAGMDALDATL